LSNASLEYYRHTSICKCIQPCGQDGWHLSSLHTSMRGALPGITAGNETLATSLYLHPFCLPLHAGCRSNFSLNFPPPFIDIMTEPFVFPEDCLELSVFSYSTAISLVMQRYAYHVSEIVLWMSPAGRISQIVSVRASRVHVTAVFCLTTLCRGSLCG
jgi:hypothetical protein